MQNRMSASQRDALLTHSFRRRRHRHQLRPGADGRVGLRPDRLYYDDRRRTDGPQPGVLLDRHDQTTSSRSSAGRALNPELRFFAAPWSPPAWMKTRVPVCGTLARSGTPRMPVLREVCAAYAAAGLPIHTLAPQNEPLNNTGAYPSAGMSAAQQSTFIATSSTGTGRRRNRHPDRVLQPNWDEWNYPVTVLGDRRRTNTPSVRPFTVTPVSLGADQRPRRLPGQGYLLQEISGGDWATSFLTTRLVLAQHHHRNARNWGKTPVLEPRARRKRRPAPARRVQQLPRVVTITAGTAPWRWRSEYYASRTPASLCNRRTAHRVRDYADTIETSRSATRRLESSLPSIRRPRHGGSTPSAAAILRVPPDCEVGRDVRLAA